MTLYDKVQNGKRVRYVAVADTEACSGLHEGTWIVVVRSGSKSMRRLLEPDMAPFLATLEPARQAAIDACLRVRDPKLDSGWYPDKEKAARAWDAWKAIMGDEYLRLEGSSANDVANAMVEAMAKVAADVAAEGRVPTVVTHFVVPPPFEEG